MAPEPAYRAGPAAARRRRPADRGGRAGGAGAGCRARRHAFSSSTAAHASPADTMSPTKRRRWARVTRSPTRAVRYTASGDCGLRHRGMHSAHQPPL